MGSPLESATFIILHRDVHGTPDRILSHEEDTATHVLASINLCILLLKDTLVQQAFTNFGQKFIKNYQSRFDSKQDNVVEEVTQTYLEKIFNGFPLVFVDDSITDPNTVAIHFRHFWKGDFKPRGQSITLNGKKVEDMRIAAEKAAGSSESNSNEHKRYRNFISLFGTSLLHELAHMFVTFLYEGDAKTPPEIDAASLKNPNKLRGESGRYLEELIFGGVLAYAYNEDEDEGQAGVPHLLHEEPEENGRISQETIDAMIGGNFQFPLTVSGKPITDPLKGWPSAPSADDDDDDDGGTDPWSYPELSDILFAYEQKEKRNYSDPLGRPETENLLKQNTRPKRLRIGPTSNLCKVAFQPSLRAQVA